jgi:Phage integrase, N-terminal SAM-like domain
MLGAGVVLPSQGRAAGPAALAASRVVLRRPAIRTTAAKALRRAEAHGWDRSSARCVLDGIVTVLESRPSGQRVPMSEIRARTHRHVPKPRLAEVLADLDLLDDDTTPAIRAWIDRVVGEVAPGFADTVRRWLLVLLVLLEGDAHARARSEATLYAYFGSVRPFLDQWAGRHSHLREVTKSDIYAVLDLLRGYQRNNAIHALRSLFGFAKKRGLVFTNPTVGVKARQIDPEMVPMTETEIRAMSSSPPSRRSGSPSPWPPSTPLAPASSATSPSTTWTCPTSASPSTDTTSGSAS